MRKSMKSEFSQYLKASREGSGMSQVKLARQTGLNPSHINRLEAGKRNPPKRENLLAIANALGLDDKEIALLFQTAGYWPPSVDVDRISDGTFE